MASINDFIEQRFHHEIVERFTIERTEGEYTSYPETLAPELAGVLGRQGICQLYRHQREAFDSISGGNDTLIVSNTASGKTLSFFLPIMNQYLTEQQAFTTLLLYPTKALSRDQESTFSRLMAAATRRGGLGTFDGDTPAEERERLTRSADFIITNPDMLHNGILPNHNRRWRSFLSRLRYIVIDEVHTYRGAYGSHVANVFRRLLRVCAIHGVRPIFICSSATVGNPAAHGLALLGRQFTVINRDSAPRPDRHFFFINPPVGETAGGGTYRRGTGSISVSLIREAAERRVRTICFCRARQEVERLYRAVTDDHPELLPLIKPYRGGLLPGERRQLENDLAAGKILVIISTNALELGIDIGDLDLAILSGYPGSVASFWQQAGRVGRKTRPATVVFVARERPVDQYLINHPSFIRDTPVEQALLNADNPYIVLQHLPCAAQEYPLRNEEEHFSPLVYGEGLSLLKRQGVVVPYRDAYRYALPDFPARGVNLRGMTDYNVDIYCGTEVIGELDPIGARGTLYKDAIYQHLGTKYISMELDLDKKLCRVEPAEVDYFTEAVWESRVDLRASEDRGEVNGARLEFGLVHVNKQPKLYKKIRERSLENVGYGPITLPAFEYDTMGFSIVAPREWSEAMEATNRAYIDSAYYGIGYLLRHTAPLFCMADPGDIDTDMSLVLMDSGDWKQGLYLYDAIDGGVGYAEKVFDRIRDCLAMSLELVEGCQCSFGCPSCVPPMPPGADAGELEEFLLESNGARECTRSMLLYLVRGEISSPQITSRRVSHSSRPAAVHDRERRQVQVKLNRAALLLRERRERLH